MPEIKKGRPERNSNLYNAYFLCSSYMWPFIYSFAFFTFSRYITNSQYDQVPGGFIDQLVEHCIGIAEVMGSNPVQALIFFFFQAFISQLLKLCVHV